MKSSCVSLWALVSLVSLASVTGAQDRQNQNDGARQTDGGQQAVASGVAGTGVPRLVKFSGTLKDHLGQPLSETVGVTFALYKDPEGGSPLWLETQNLTPDAQGHYSVLLGATRNEGLPLDLFTAGVNYSELPYLMLQAIKDLKAENDSLRAELKSALEYNKASEAQLQERLRRLEVLLAGRAGK